MRPVLLACYLATSLAACATAPDPVYEAFRSPPSQARPFVRWWWNGARVEAGEIARELDVMKAAGIGGVEINTIAMPEATPPETLAAFPEHPWLGPSWNRLVRSATDAARARGMVADIIVGSGWPFGARFLRPEEQIQRVRVNRKRLDGPTTISLSSAALLAEAATSGRKGRREGVAPTAERLMFLRLVPADAKAFVPGEELLPRLPAEGALDLEVPAGTHTLYVGLWEQGFSHVKLGAPGADGPVVDHLNAQAVRRYLDRMSRALGPALGGRLGDGLRATFVDSLELDGANWTGDLADEFQRRHGYALGPYLPFVLDDEDAGRGEGDAFGETVRRARQDFVGTIVDLFHDRFLATYVAWCHDNGVAARMQAYGREAHPLEGSLAVDLPEGETWIWRDKEQRERTFVESTVVNRYVASAARLAGRRLVSFEAMTNAVPVFRETPDDFKLGMDLSVIAGVNHPIVHGFNYSPPGAGFPGWVRFGSWLNERNPWWPHFPRWANYAARLSALLRVADPVTQIAILAPRADEWARRGLLYQPFPEAKVPWYQYALAEELQRHGVGADFVSEGLLRQAAVEGTGEARLRVRDRRYQLVVVEEAESLAPETVELLARLAEAGGRVVFIGRLPSRAPGLRDAAARDGRVQAAASALARAAADRVAVLPAPAPAGDTARLFAFAGELVRRFGLRPPVVLEPPHPSVSQLHLTIGPRQVFFFANGSRARGPDEVAAFTARFATGDRRPWRWDPETGERTPVAHAGDPARLDLALGPNESLLLVFEPGPGPEAEGAWRPSAMPAAGAGDTDLSSNWTVRLAHVDPARSTDRALPTLIDLATAPDPALATFAGVATYARAMHVKGPAPAWLDLGVVHGVSEVSLNGRPLGVRWYGRHVYDVREAVRSGRNDLQVKVTVMLGNHMKSLSPGHPVAHRWARGFPPIPAGLVGPVTLASAKPGPVSAALDGIEPGAPSTPEAPIRLIVRVDDMGALHGVNLGIVETLSRGIATTVEVIAAGPWFPEAVRLLQQHPKADVGLHLAFTSEWENARWRPLTPAPGLVDADGFFFPFIWRNKNMPPGSALLEVHPQPDLAQIEAEVRAQMTLIKRHLPRTSHVTGHMGCARATPEIRALVERLAREHELTAGPSGAKPLPFSAIPYPGAKGSPAEKERALLAALETVGPGTWEFIEHPATDDPEMRAITHRGYENVAADRAGVTHALTSDRVKQTIRRRGIQLIGYKDLPRP